MGFNNYTAQISLRDPEDKSKYIGSDENWKLAEKSIIEAAKEKVLRTCDSIWGSCFLWTKTGLHGEGCYWKQMAIRNNSSRL